MRTRDSAPGGRGVRRAGPVAVVGLMCLAPAPLAWAASVSSAATPGAAIHVDRACYVRTGKAPPSMTITGTGFEPGEQVTITDARNSLDATTTADATGAISASVVGPSLVLAKPGQVRDAIIATDRTAAGSTIVARTTTHVSILGAGHGQTRSERGLRALTERTQWVFSGWPVNRSIYVHYLVKGRAVARQSFGRPPGPCGVLHTIRRLFPKTPHVASYKTQIDTDKRYSPKTNPRFTLLRVGLQLRFGPGEAG